MSPAASWALFVLLAAFLYCLFIVAAGRVCGYNDRAAAETDPCRCGHAVVVHEHLRRGTNCALCACRCYIARPGGGDVEVVRRLGAELGARGEAGDRP